MLPLGETVFEKSRSKSKYMVQYGIKGFKSKDLEYFDFVISTLRGDLWK